MKTGIVAFALLAAVSLPPTASAQSPFEAGASDPGANPAPARRCAATDLQGSWLATFETRDDTKAACLFNVLAGGGLRDGVCLRGNATNTSPMAGKLAIDADKCQVTGTVTMAGIGKYSFIVHIAADKSTMTGVLLNIATNDFLPVAVTQWPAMN